jgi:hypothetical protein
MPDASAPETKEATRRWFGVLQTLDRIVARRERERESLGPHVDDSLKSTAKFT